ncbi:IclR family transcriptional regulator [Achromobacter sp. UMC71]|uniref:IclR family transcriptional regulator n=1 Tax=Achromobacter sp. UMC71 TaxID=1862320 RepID=UPI0016019F1F|nr:IclR family transcriptional regulator [Achromobacter sp. UMC71]
MKKEVAAKTDTEGGKQGVQAAETVLRILIGFIDSEPMPMLKKLAEKVDMHPAKVHRYLVSLTRAGFVEQDSETSRYRLGPSAIRLGLSALSAIDSILVARPLLYGISLELGHATILAMWNDGPTIVLKELGPGFISATAREGAVLPILTSATGRSFGAWMPWNRVEPLVKAELVKLRANPIEGCPSSMAGVESLFAEIREQGVARVTGQLSSSFHALSAPIFDGSGELASVICTLGAVGSFNSDPSGATAMTLRAAAQTLSRALGYRAAN